jgi:hypothetical protein
MMTRLVAIAVALVVLGVDDLLSARVADVRLR